MPLRHGVHAPLEEAANALIYEQVRQIKKHSENDILTPWKEKDRRRHELYVTSGIPDPANRLGIFHRVTNPVRPEMNSREGWSRVTPSIYRQQESTLASFIDEHGMDQNHD